MKWSFQLRERLWPKQHLIRLSARADDLFFSPLERRPCRPTNQSAQEKRDEQRRENKKERQHSDQRAIRRASTYTVVVTPMLARVGSSARAEQVTRYDALAVFEW